MQMVNVVSHLIFCRPFLLPQERSFLLRPDAQKRVVERGVLNAAVMPHSVEILQGVRLLSKKCELPGLCGVQHRLWRR